jgi:cell division protein FtsB
LRIQAILFPVLALALGGYFIYHLEIGDHGLKARANLDQRKEALKGELAGLQEVRERLERDVALMRPESLDPDMLDERARAILNLARRDDVVMLKRRRTISEVAAGSK